MMSLCIKTVTHWRCRRYGPPKYWYCTTPLHTRPSN